MSIAEKLARFNLYMTFLWIALTPPSLFFWSNSILWVIVISLWANIVGHFGAYLAAHSEAAQEKGHNLTEQDMEWILQQLTSLDLSTTICQPPATTATTITAKPKSDHPS